MKTEILSESLQTAIDQFVEASEQPTLGKPLQLISSNTWCKSAPTSVGVASALASMLTNDIFEEILIVGKCFDAGVETPLADIIHNLEGYTGHTGDTVFPEDANATCHFIGDNHSITVVENLPADFEELDNYAAVLHLDFENSCPENSAPEIRMGDQANLITELVERQQGGLTFFISNCVTGILQQVFGPGDEHAVVSTIDVQDLGLDSQFEPCEDIITYRDRWNSLVVPTRNPFEEQYRAQIQEIFEAQRFSGNRTEFGSIQEFGGYMCYDLRQGFPLMTGKFTSIKDISRELKFFNRGETNANTLREYGCKVWNGEKDKPFEAEGGDLGPIYGEQWRNWADTRIVDTHDEAKIRFLESQGYEKHGLIENTNNIVYTRKLDQLKDAIEKIKNNPNDRRVLVTALNPGLAPFDKIRMPVEQRLQQLIEDRIIDTASDYEDEYEAEGYDSSEEMARHIIEEQYGEYENLTHEKLDLLKAPDGMIPFSPSENAEAGQQCLPPCHVLFQLGALPMDINERISHYAYSKLDEKYFAGNPRACTNFSAIITRTHELVAEEIDREMGDDPSIDDVNAYLTSKGVPDHYLDLSFYQRSADMFYGIPYNAASYSLELLAIAHETGYAPRRVHHYLGNKHVYENQIKEMQELMNRPMATLPEVEIHDFDGIENFDENCIELKYYQHAGKLKSGKVAV